jgi:hypothetical protein
MKVLTKLLYRKKLNPTQRTGYKPDCTLVKYSEAVERGRETGWTSDLPRSSFLSAHCEEDNDFEFLETCEVLEVLLEFSAVGLARGRAARSQKGITERHSTRAREDEEALSGPGRSIKIFATGGKNFQAGGGLEIFILGPDTKLANVVLPVPRGPKSPTLFSLLAKLRSSEICQIV